MKTIKLFIIGSLTVLALIGRSQELQITFKVIDDFEKPVSGASVSLFTYQTTKAGDGFGEDVYKKTTGITDTNGMATLEGSSSHSDIKCGIALQPGYYYTEPSDYQLKQSQGGKWQPWNPTIELVLKPIIKPVPVYAYHVQLDIPKTNTPVGFDLKVGDWVTPYGKGSVSDLIFQMGRKADRMVKTDDYYKRDVKLFDATLTASFSNEDDGIQSVYVKPHIGSELRLPRFAPEKGYQPQLIERKYCESPNKPTISDLRDDQNYFFRVRTKKVEGKIVSALYGKIEGNIDFDVINSPTAIIVFSYSLNPESNSRNMEFDPKRNLFNNLKPDEGVSAP